jgi:uncharacterized phage protein (TIGR01671 family)
MNGFKVKAWDGTEFYIPIIGIDGRLYRSDRDFREGNYAPNDDLILFTGLKDKNGKEIYEGDVLDGSWLNPMTNEVVKKFYEVSYERGRYLAKLIGHHPYGTTMLYFENEIAEVIGNKFQNPELLGGENNG